MRFVGLSRTRVLCLPYVIVATTARWMHKFSAWIPIILLNAIVADECLQNDRPVSDPHSSSAFKLTLTFFEILLPMKEITNSDAFLVGSTQSYALEVDSLVTLETTLFSSFLLKAFDLHKDGWILHREVRTALEQQKSLNKWALRL